jgi:hypothetical protein
VNRWLRLVLAVLAGSLVAAPAVVHADTYTYDAGAIARVDVDVVGNVGRGPALVSDVRRRGRSGQPVTQEPSQGYLPVRASSSTRSSTLTTSA